MAQFLNGKTVGGTVLTLASNLFIGPMPDTDHAPNSPSVAVLNTGGEAPAPYLDDSRRAAYSGSVQVMVRGGTEEFAAGEAIARAIIGWCHQRATAGYVSWFSRDSQPAFLGNDGDSHPMWSINIDAEFDATLG